MRYILSLHDYVNRIEVYRLLQEETSSRFASLMVDRQITEEDQMQKAQRFGLIQHLPSGLYDGGKKDRE